MNLSSNACLRAGGAAFVLLASVASCRNDGQSQVEALRAARVKLAPAARVQSVAQYVLDAQDVDPREGWLRFCTELNAAFDKSPTTTELVAPIGSRMALPADDEFARNLRDYLRRLVDSADDAGRVSTQMVGGKDTTEYPDCVGIGDGQRICCSGVLVTQQTVVTAGHCLDEKGGCPADGGHRAVYFSPSTAKPAGEWIGVRAVQASTDRPSGYKGGPEYQRDLLVLVLDTPVQTKPATILPEEMLGEVSLVTLVGFGSNKVAGTTGVGTKRAAPVAVLRKICQPTDAQYKCHAGYELVASNEPTTIGQAVGACFGDSGGPAYAEFVRDGKRVRYVVGSVSRGTLEQLLNTTCGSGTICVRLAPFESWIFSIK